MKTVSTVIAAAAALIAAAGGGFIMVHGQHRGAEAPRLALVTVARANDAPIYKLEFIVLDVGACDGDRTGNGNTDERRPKDAQ